MALAAAQASPLGRRWSKAHLARNIDHSRLPELQECVSARCLLHGARLCQSANLLATRKAAYENVQVTLDHLRPTLNGRAFYQHLRSLGPKRPPFFYPRPAPHPRYRIPFWNIAPGDQVRVKEDAMSVPTTLEGRIGTVVHVDRLYNRVFLREKVFKRVELRDVPESSVRANGPDQVELEVHRGILYGDLQLIIGKYDLEVENYVARITRKTPPGEDNPNTRQLVALSLSTKGRRWDNRQLRFLWDRVPKSVRALVPGSGKLEPWLVPIPKDSIASPNSPKRVPWNHEEGFDEGAPIEGTIRKPKPPVSTSVFDTAPEVALKATWEPPDLRQLWANHPGGGHLRRSMPEFQVRYDPELGNKTNQRKRRRLHLARIRYRVRKYLRSKRYGFIRDKVEMPAIGGYRGPQWARSKRPPNKQRERRIAAGKDPNNVYGRETGLDKHKGYGGRAWPI